MKLQNRYDDSYCVQINSKVGTRGKSGKLEHAMPRRIFVEKKVGGVGTRTTNKKIYKLNHKHSNNRCDKILQIKKL